MIDIATEEFVTESIDDGLWENSPLIDELSASHVGKWNRLISQTNWEKGAVILRWRNEMITAELPRSAYSDEAWAKRVGNVSGQHVGRLRRVAERFGNVAVDYPNLYWSHFQAALDWESPEMWLEGAVQNDWSVAQMKVQRWEATGAPAHLRPQEQDIFTAEIDEDVNPRNDSLPGPAERTQPRIADIGPADIGAETPPFDGADEPEKKKPKRLTEKNNGPSEGELLKGFKNLTELPEDLRDSLEMLKVAILNHKLSGWQNVSSQKLLGLLDALKALVVAVD